MLPDDILLNIFDFYRSNPDDYPRPVREWHVLVHVCQRWRHVVFASAQRLKLQILCTHGTPVRKNLSIWPAFPIVLHLYPSRRLTPNDEDIVLAALEHPNRVSSVRLYETDLLLEKMIALMLEPFPLLTRLFLVSRGGAPVFPVEFLGGSAPLLQEISLSGIPYPALPTLLLSTSDLITLTLEKIPEDVYISPEAMCACLAALPRLKSFTLEFPWDTPHPDQIRPPPITRTVLPSLIFFHFEGDAEYLEDLVSQMDSPQLAQIDIVNLHSPANLQFPQLSTFIERSVGPEPPRHAMVSIERDQICITFYRYVNRPDWFRHSVSTTIYSSYKVLDLTQVLSQFSATLFTVVGLELYGEAPDERLQATVDDEWLEIFRQFPALQMLLVAQEPAECVARVLNVDLGGMVAEVFPFLDLIYLEDEPASSVEAYGLVAARRLSDRPITVVETFQEFYERLDSYLRK